MSDRIPSNLEGTPRPWKLTTVNDQTTVDEPHQRFEFRDAKGVLLFELPCNCDVCLEGDESEHGLYSPFEDPQLILRAVNAYQDVYLLREQDKGWQAKLAAKEKELERSEAEIGRVEQQLIELREATQSRHDDVEALIRWGLRAGADPLDVRGRLGSSLTDDMIRQIALEPHP